jgi:hypothetical protein
MKLPEIPITAEQVLLGGLWPALIALSVVGLDAILPLRRRGWLTPIALLAGFAAAYPLINGAAPRFPPNSAGDWLFWLSMPAAVVAALMTYFRAPWPVRIVVGAAVIGAMLYFMMQPALATRTAGEWWVLWAVLVGILTIDLWLIDRSLSCDDSLVSLAGLVGILLGACILIQMSGSLKFAFQGVALVASLTAILILTAMGLPRPAAGGVALVSTAIVGSLLAVSIEPLFVYVKISNALLIAAAPLFLWLGTFIKMPQQRAWIHTAIRLALPAAPVLAALAIAGAKAMADMQRSGSEGYYGY